MLAETTSFTLDGISARPVRVEVDIHRGLPSFQIVGLPDAAVREARERVRAALVNSGFEFPMRRITANLAPADLRKAGPGLDLALATALLVAGGEIAAAPLGEWALAGELALDGSVRPVRGALAMTEAARARGCRGVILPTANGPEAALAPGVEIRTIESISELRQFGDGRVPGSRPQPLGLIERNDLPDLCDLRGQANLRRAIEVAAAGGHALLMVGPPGSGKSLAARRMPSVLPPMSSQEILEVARIAGICGAGPPHAQRPFRAPHHTVSPAGLVGGGSPPRPGEITLAHRGVLFLDELCEFRRPTLEALREPLESGEVTISRANGRRVLPAGFTLVAAANPCPCGRGEEDPDCRCSAAAIARYSGTLSGALADRIDMIVGVAQPTPEAMAGEEGEASAVVRERVIQARERMTERLGCGRPNAVATRAEVSGFLLDSAARELLLEAGRGQRLSGRSHDRVLRLARTVADLDGSRNVGENHLAAALQLEEVERMSLVQPGSESACTACLRRSWLIARLGPFIQVACDDRAGRRTPELLRLSDEDLVAAVAPRRADELLSGNDRLDEGLLRNALVDAGCWACCTHDAGFPEGLEDGADAPCCLVGRGDTFLLEEVTMSGSVTVVGARRATGYGLEVARMLGAELASAGLVVISGLALGIDGAVHRGAVERGRTVAVLAGGPDRPYPVSHTRLYRSVLERGLVVSELPPGTRPWRWGFPARNRIMAALSRMTVVVEAARRSGSLITAEMAADAGREVGAVPGPVTAGPSAGTNELIAAGAALIRGGEDVIERLAGMGLGTARTLFGPEVGEQDRLVLNAVECGHSLIDSIAPAAGVGVAAVATGLARLEIAGYVTCSLTGEYRRTGLPVAEA